MIRKYPGLSPGTLRVLFELPAQFWAESVYLVGDFNDWDTAATPMTQSGPEGEWRVMLELETGKEYQFRYVADGVNWHNDSAADKYVPNDKGSDNSVVIT
ncbi:MAG: isoamylase early set domain-containing protein [Anaerolineae bacterium]